MFSVKLNILWDKLQLSFDLCYQSLISAAISSEESNMVTFTHIRGKNNIPDLLIRRLSVILLLILVWIPTNLAVAQSTRPAANTADNKAPQAAIIQNSINESIQSETTNIGYLKNELSLAESLKKNLDAELNAYRVQQTAFSSLLFMPNAQLRILQNAFDALQISFAAISDRIEKMSAQQGEAIKMQSTAEEQYNLVSKQQTENAAAGRKTQSRTINKSLQALKKLITEKQTLLKKLNDIYTTELNRLNEVKTAFSQLSTDYNKTFAEHSRRNLFYRELNPFSKGWMGEVKKMSTEVVTVTRLLSTPDFWTNKIQSIFKWEIYGFLTFILLLGSILILSWRIRKAIIALDVRFYGRYKHTEVPLILLQRTLLPLGTILFLYAYLYIVDITPLFELIRVAIELLTVWIISSWGLSLAANWDFQMVVLPESLKRRFRLFLFYVRWFVIVFVLVSWLFQYNKLILLVGRLILEVSLIGFAVFLWRTVRFKGDEPKSAASSRRLIVNALRWGSYSIMALGLIFELAGYGALASFWYLSWARTAVVIMWSFFILIFLSELNRLFKGKEDSDLDLVNVTAYQIRWFSIRLARVFFPVAFILAIILSWGGTQSIASNTYSVLSYKFKFGDTTFSLLSFIYAILVLLATSLVTRLWRNVFQNKFLRNSLMEFGLQESITTITVYVIWVLGIIFALNVFGLNPTSLIVVFGALGIGLGFGLQNIFNNFMSGLILLFERPIQVGDEIEVTGTWATVKKINVRSTLVQTYDNASLIIPNSELINNQVTNWTFKDKRLRRQISVGVAYGSDIELVRQTLLEIADRTPRVLKNPDPDVLFTDFGDSALIFVLRVWTQQKYMWQVDTSIRFAIDHEFKEKKITIAFPQRDVHIHTVEKEDTPDA
jgi:potassium-dependent mechanosensitive channel